MPIVFLHAEGSGLIDATGPMLVVGLLAVVASGLGILRFGTRAGLLAAAVGAVCLIGGLTGDLRIHAGQDAQRQELLGYVLTHADAGTAAELHALDDAEAMNPWHLVAAAGEALLVTGLAGTCLLFWRQGYTVAPAADRPDRFGRYIAREAARFVDRIRAGSDVPSGIPK